MPYILILKYKALNAKSNFTLSKAPGLVAGFTTKTFKSYSQ
jgi:hypothetical protein